MAAHDFETIRRHDYYDEEGSVNREVYGKLSIIYGEEVLDRTYKVRIRIRRHRDIGASYIELAVWGWNHTGWATLVTIPPQRSPVGDINVLYADRDHAKALDSAEIALIGQAAELLR